LRGATVSSQFFVRFGSFFQGSNGWLVDDAGFRVQDSGFRLRKDSDVEGLGFSKSRAKV